MDITGIVRVLSGAPAWVWIVFVYLVIVGIKGMHERFVWLPMTFMLPVLLMLVNMRVLSTMNQSDFLLYLATLTCGIALGWCISYRTRVEVFKDKLLVKIPGSRRLLIILLLLFFTKFVFGYLKATSETMMIAGWDLRVIEACFSALFTGYFLGHALCWTAKMRRAL